MAINEDARQQLYRALEEALGHAPAATLMERLLPVPWGDMATKVDLEALEARLDGRFAAIDGRFARLEGSMEGRFGEVAKEFGLVHKEIGEIHLRIAEWGRTLVLANVATMVAAVSLAFAASRL